MMSQFDEIAHLELADKQYIWHPFTQMRDWLDEKPLIITEGTGCFIKDFTGNWYLDGVSSLWVNIHGHGRKEINEAVRQQLNKIAHSTLLGLCNVPSIELAEKLISLTDLSFDGLTPRLSKVFYSDNGSTSIEIALKMAFQYWLHKGLGKKHRFLALNNSYHGDTIGAMGVGGVEIFHNVFKPLLTGSFKAPSPYCYRCELKLRYPECFMSCLRKMEDMLNAHSDEIAAVIVEPMIQAAGGMIIWPEGYLKGVRDLCTRYNVLLIADEVATGFGRTGKMFACEHESVVPDIICLSKGITNGYMPLAVTLTTDEIFNMFLGEFRDLKTFFHGHSYTGNPLACAAAIASINIFEKDATLRKIPAKSDILYSNMLEIAELPHAGNVRHKGLVGAIELVKEKSSRESYPWEDRMGWKIAHRMREYGVIMRPLGNIMVIMPPLSISSDNLDHLMKILKKTIIEITGTE